MVPLRILFNTTRSYLTMEWSSGIPEDIFGAEASGSAMFTSRWGRKGGDGGEACAEYGWGGWNAGDWGAAEAGAASDIRLLSSFCPCEAMFRVGGFFSLCVLELPLACEPRDRLNSSCEHVRDSLCSHIPIKAHREVE